MSRVTYDEAGDEEEEEEAAAEHDALPSPLQIQQPQAVSDRVGESISIVSMATGISS